MRSSGSSICGAAMPRWQWRERARIATAQALRRARRRSHPRLTRRTTLPRDNVNWRGSRPYFFAMAFDRRCDPCASPGSRTATRDGFPGATDALCSPCSASKGRWRRTVLQPFEARRRTAPQAFDGTRRWMEVHMSFNIGRRQVNAAPRAPTNATNFPERAN